MGDYSHLRDSSRYQSNVLISNWLEERELRRTQLKQLLSNKTGGTLKLDAFNRKMATALQEVELTKITEDDGFSHFGDVIQFVHLETSSVLAVDSSDADTRPGELSCAATAAPQVTSPCARNTFVIVRYTPPPGSPLEPDYGDEVLRYGQKLRLAVNPAALGSEVDAQGGPRPLCLFSKPVSTTHCSKYTRHQLVGFTYRNSFDSVWEVITPDPAHRALSVGLEVLTGAPVMLIHCATQKPLLVENQKYPNDFGMELEVSARSSINNGMKSVCEMTTKGLLKGSLNKSEHSDSFWTFMGGSKVGVLPPSSQSTMRGPSEGSAEVEGIVADLLSSHGGIYPLERKLVTLSQSYLQLPADELLLILRQVGLLSVDERVVSALASQFQVPSKPGSLDAAALLKALRIAAGGSGSPLSTLTRTFA